MADTLVERITGQATAEDVNVEIQVLVPVEALLDPASPLPAELPGFGPLPVEMLSTAEGRTTLRRLFTRDGAVIGGDARSRGFRGPLAKVIGARDGGRCTAPYCDAPIRHTDHRLRRCHGGRTSLDNGRGLCAFHNHVREIGVTRRQRPKRRSTARSHE
jgi:hypothetical protein